jgi:phenylacetate-CoA ligase
MYGALLYRAAVTVRGEASVFSRLATLRAMEGRPQEEILASQREALARVLRDKIPHIPHYRSFSGLAAEVSPNDVVERLEQLPILEKEVLQKTPEALRVDNWHGRAYAKTTGGSTGRPVTVKKNPEAIAWEMAASWLGFGWFGVEIGDPCVRFWGQPSANLKRRLRYLAADAAMNRRTLSAFGYTRTTLDRYLSRIRRFGPRYLYGYVSVLEDLARHLIEANDSFEDLGLKSVITTSEVLTDPQRSVLKAAFGVPVQDEYGCGEVGPIAYECRDGSLHLMTTNHFVEILDESGRRVSPGVPGSVVVTDLRNDVMPLIRYRVGDTAAYGESCGCGRPFPVLSGLFGREYDFVEAADGRRFHGEFFMYLFEDLRAEYPSIGQFQVVQCSADELLVRVVLSDREEQTSRGVRKEVLRRLEGFEVQVEPVDRIEREPSGKMRVVRNRMQARRDTHLPEM